MFSSRTGRDRGTSGAGFGRAWQRVTPMGTGVCRRCAAGLSWPGADETGSAGDRTPPARGDQAQGRAGYSKKSRGLLREGVAVKCGFIVKHRGSWPTAWLCEALGVSRGGFYAWLTRPQSQHARRDEVLSAKIRTSFLQSDRTYGARRVWHDLLAEGEVCGLHRIERLMRKVLDGLAEDLSNKEIARRI